MASCLITRRGGGAAAPMGMPVYSYTGQSILIDDGNHNWRIKCLTSGTLNFTDFGTGQGSVDLFAVGGGGAGQPANSRAQGGGGGYTATLLGIVLGQSTTYSIQVGAGGASGSNGEASCFGGVLSAGGGLSGARGASPSDGGSAGGKAAYTSGSGGNGASNGCSTEVGTGQGTTTRAFGDSDGECYAGGGGGSVGSAPGSSDHGGNGGDGGGGRGYTSAVSYAQSGLPNTGGGGGGGRISAGAYSCGGSGIVILRNKRGV